MWLDSVLNDTYRNMMQLGNPQGVNKMTQQWQRSRDVCTSSVCLRWAYLQGIGQLYHAPESFSWSGEWWNTSATNGNGGRLIISNVNQWTFDFDAMVWGGTYKTTLRGNVRMFRGVGFVDNIKWGAGCPVIFIPHPDGKITISSDNGGSCKLLMQRGMAIDGVYQRADNDPRPAAALLSMGIFPSKALDDRFRQLVGKDYQQYVNVANSITYATDLDDINATVVTLALKGDASHHAAIIMYTPDGRIWASRVMPKSDKQREVHTDYMTTEKGQKNPPNTINHWRALFDS
ncbi:hypothetical protein EB241_09770 [Erwinia psidii]|uniref:Uncharacterized protein n=1 Tax=Erwinia psidii TaxID=69224 RepID=A0A3N6S118_9GAMM|nr:hypothetical protein EB241_09770 [Erwinia psidii]